MRELKRAKNMLAALALSAVTPICRSGRTILVLTGWKSRRSAGHGLEPKSKSAADIASQGEVISTQFVEQRLIYFVVCSVLPQVIQHSH